MSPRSRRAGFTLVELLVVIALIGILIGLLLPAVQSAREAGRRATCINNQYQLARGLMQADDANGFLPGWRNSVNGQSMSWTGPILPFIERNDVFSAITPTVAPAGVYIALFVCPSTPVISGLSNFNSSQTVFSPDLHYGGNCGSASNAGPNASGLLAPRCDGVMVDTLASGTMAFRLSLDTISENDGTATTLMLSEKCSTRLNPSLTPSNWNTGVGASGAFTFSSGTSAVPGFGLTTNIPAIRVINAPVLGNGNLASGQMNAPSSSHPGGVVAVFADGHTAFLKESLNRGVYAQILSWNGAAASAISRSTWGGTDLLSEASLR